MADGCTTLIMRNDTSQRGTCGKKVFRNKLCEDCFFTELARLNGEYKKHRDVMKESIKKIIELFGKTSDDDDQTEN